MQLPPFLSGKLRATKYKCLDCGLLMDIEDAECPHCKAAVTDQKRKLMKENYSQNVKNNTPALFVVAALIVFLVLWVSLTS
jgi:DNA-directed RNA polymerase subunit RPC12/RpoP